MKAMKFFLNSEKVTRKQLIAALGTKKFEFLMKDVEWMNTYQTKVFGNFGTVDYTVYYYPDEVKVQWKYSK